jgi:hypothetical protein
MNTGEIARTLTILFGELIDGVTRKQSYTLNTGDTGLLASLDGLSAAAASRTSAGGTTIAAHVDHLLYGLRLMNRWQSGEQNPWADADWTASWRRTSVDDEEWMRLRAQLRDEAHRWLGALGTPRDVEGVQLTFIVSSIAHLAYHLGAIRQIDRVTRGPTAEAEAAAKAAAR